MGFDENLASRVRALLVDRTDITERRMFGGLAFMVGGHMSCGVIGDDLVLRLGADVADAALDEPHTRPMDFTGRPMSGFIYLAPEGATAEGDLRRWIDRSLAFAAELPPK
jgi:TfoX/Sxy family transcriptional regulator of competence genes